MNNFKKPYGKKPRSGGGGGKSFGSRGPIRSRDAYPKNFQKFDAICSNCGNACQVPFRPDGKKPVYCNNCFSAPRGENSRPQSQRKSFEPRPPVGTKTVADLERQIGAMNTKIDTMLGILKSLIEADASEEE